MTIHIRTVRPILVLPSNAPPIPMPLEVAAATITENFAAVQDNVLKETGSTFALDHCLIYRSDRPATYNLWRFFDEMYLQAATWPSLPAAPTMYYAQIWNPQPMQVGITGTQMPAVGVAGRCLDDAGPIEDFLGLPKMRLGAEPMNRKNTWKNQARGRIRHEIEHGLGGAHPERIFGNWWDYGMKPPHLNIQRKNEEIATLDQRFLIIR